LDANTFAHEYHDYDIQASKPVYKPYVFCDAYTCQFNLSKTHKYKIVDDYDVVFSAGSEFMNLIYGYFHPNQYWGYKDKICSDTTCFIPISDLDALNVMFDKLKNNITEEDLRYAGWTLIEIND